MTPEHYGAIIVACGIGDTLGMPVEGFKKEQIRKYVGRITKPIAPVIITDNQGNIIEHDEYGKFKSWTKDFKINEYTDDTLRTKSLAESIIASNGYNLNDLAQRELKAYQQLKKPDGTIHGGFGKTTMQGYERLAQGISPYDSGVIGGPGNAPCMMMHSIGMHMTHHNYDEGLQYARDVGRMTHHDPRSIASGILQAHAIYTILTKTTREHFIDHLQALCSKIEEPLTDAYALHKDGTLTERLNWVQQHRDTDANTAHQTLGSNSNVYASYPFALYMVQKHWDDPLNGLLNTINYGGDCDTTGAIAGALFAARHGAFYPQEWAQQLKDGHYLQTLGEQLYHT